MLFAVAHVGANVLQDWELPQRGILVQLDAARGALGTALRHVSPGELFSAEA